MVHSGRVLLILFLDMCMLAYVLPVTAITRRYMAMALYLPYAASPYADISGLALYFFLCLLSLFFFYMHGHYNSRPTWWRQVREILTVFGLVLMIDGFMEFLLHHEFSRMWVAFSWIYAALLVICGRNIAHRIGEKMNVWSIPTAIIGDGENAIAMLWALHADTYPGYRPRAVLWLGEPAMFDRHDLPYALQSISVTFGSTALNDFFNAHQNDCFYVWAPEEFQGSGGEEFIATLTACSKNQYAFVPPSNGLQFYGMYPEYFFGHGSMLLRPRKRLSSSFWSALKRVTDIIIVLLAGLILLPIMLLIALWIKRDGGPALFGHQRVGMHGAYFTCYKFRTMCMNAETMLNDLIAKNAAMREEWERNRALTNDPRVSQTGKFLRKTSLDELPQLWNVLKGDMSIVGPRPVTAEELKYYQDKPVVYNGIRPGITGMFQVSGRKKISFRYRVVLDSWYFEHWSFCLDFVIMIKTIRAICDREGAG